MVVAGGSVDLRLGKGFLPSVRDPPSLKGLE